MDNAKDTTMTYDEFKAAFTRAFNDTAKYTIDQIGSRINVERMADLADKYPEFEERLFDEAPA